MHKEQGDGMACLILENFMGDGHIDLRNPPHDGIIAMLNSIHVACL